MTDEERQRIVDGEHLRVLSICYYIYAGANALFSVVGLLYVFMGLMVGGAIASMPARSDEPMPPELFGLFFAAMGFGIFVFLVGLAVLKVMAAGRLRRHRSRIFCTVVAAVTCIGIPFGTALGVLTIIVLARDSVAKLFDASAAEAAPPPPVPPPGS